MTKEVVIIGAGGHGRVIADIIECAGDVVFGFLDDNPQIADSSLKLLGKISDCGKFSDKYFIIAIGNNNIRKKISCMYPGLKYYTAIHPKASISKYCEIGEGTCIMPNAVVNHSAVVGKHCIINSGAVLEHDNRLGNFVHVSPNATLCGTVNVDEESHIGAGANVKNNIKICSNCIVGMGACVVNDINEAGVYVGVPAKKIR